MVPSKSYKEYSTGQKVLIWIGGIALLWGAISFFSHLSNSQTPIDSGMNSQAKSETAFDKSEPPGLVSPDSTPYYADFCDKIDPYDISVRKASAEAIRQDPGAYSIDQLFDIYDWVKKNVIYQNVPLGGIPYSPSETLVTKSGDCKNQAVLIASMVEAIGGRAEVVADPSCGHAYTMVYFGNDTNLTDFTQAVAKHYGQDISVNYYKENDGIWVIFDGAGGYYPGETLPECTKKSETRYRISSCLSCAKEYLDNPYTFGDKCYSECPSGTISTNKYYCSPCPSNSYSLNNKCVTCESGYILGSDEQCHVTCGADNKYCQTGSYCSNGKCYQTAK